MKKITNGLILAFISILMLSLPFSVKLLVFAIDDYARSKMAAYLFVILSGVAFMWCLFCFLFALIKFRVCIIPFVLVLILCWQYLIFANNFFLDLKVTLYANVMRHEKILYLGEAFKEYLTENDISSISSDLWCDGFTKAKQGDIAEILYESPPIACEDINCRLNEQLNEIPLESISGNTVLIVEKTTNGENSKEPYYLVYCYDGSVLKYYNDKDVFKDFHAWDKIVDAKFK